MKRIFFVTHGDKYPGANPGMTETGFEQIKALRQFFPSQPTHVVCGTGRRHLDVALALNLTPNRYSSIFGDGDSMEKVEGINMVILPDGTKLPMEAHTTLDDLSLAMKYVMSQLPDNTVVCAGRGLMIMIGADGALSAAVYLVEVTRSSIISIKEVMVQGALGHHPAR